MRIKNNKIMLTIRIEGKFDFFSLFFKRACSMHAARKVDGGGG